MKFIFIIKMAKKYRRYYRGYGRASKKVFNKIASNYTKAKFDVSKRILVTTQYIRFESGASTIAISDILDASPDYNMYRQLYLSMKITGVAATVVPMVRTNNYTGAGSYVMGLLTDNDGDGFGNIVESDKSIMLDFQHVARRYWTFNGGSTGWLDIEKGEDFPGKFGVATTDLPTAGETYWSVKFTFYMLMKNKG